MPWMKLITSSAFNLNVDSVSHLLSLCITTLDDWLTNLAPLFHPIRSKIKTNRNARACFPALCVSYTSLPLVLISSLDCLCSLWLAKVISLVLVLARHITVNTHT